MYKATTSNGLFLVGKIDEILDMLYSISRDYSNLKKYLESQDG